MFFEYEYFFFDLFIYWVFYEFFLYIFIVFVKGSVLNVCVDLKVKKNFVLFYGDFREFSCKYCDVFNDVLDFDMFRIF